MKLLTFGSNYSTPEGRKELVDFLSITIEGRKDDTFAPYMPNEGDDSFWTLDSANNWKVKFLPEPDQFELWYRYHGDYEQALVGWLQERIGAIVLK